MDANLQKALLDRVYDKRKAATLDLEKQVREALGKGDRARVTLIIQQLCTLLSSPPQNINARNGGLIGLAGISIALGVDIAPYLESIVPPVLACFTDPDSKIRYFACESFYNIAKVCKGEILIYFNDIFDALSKLAADSEVSVKNGAELLDRLLKDIVCEAAPDHVSHFQDIPHIRSRQDAMAGYSGGAAELDVAREKATSSSHLPSHSEAKDEEATAANKTFSLARFVPLLAERMYVLSPFTRNYLVGWITVLDSVPDLELVSYLPHFLDGLLKYLSDPNTDVRLATANVLVEFLREIKEAADVAAQRSLRAQEKQKQKESAEDEGTPRPDGEEAVSHDRENDDDEDAWIPGREVRIDYAAIMEILINHINYPDEEIQATTLQWIAELLVVVKDVVVPFTPRLIPAILPSLAHHSPAIQAAASETNVNLFAVIQGLPAPVAVSSPRSPRSDSPGESIKGKRRSPPMSPRLSLTSVDQPQQANNEASSSSASSDPFDYQTTVNMLALQLLDQHEETRVEALEWLLMLHSKAPQRILTMHDGTFPALLKTLSDPSEDVIRCDLRLLSQISSASEDTYFSSFMANLLQLFSTDRRLLETRGSLIIRQLCASLQTERIFRTLAELLEKDEDLEFASIMVQNLNIILISSPELHDFRRRLKHHDTRGGGVDGQHLFCALYRSWCHNAVAALSLCLLSQAYEHASNLLSVFGDLDITVAMLIQIDKLVQLLESPIFTSLRLHLLDADKNPFLLKALYGLLMLLPQSSAFATLRNRLSAASSMAPGVRSTVTTSSASAAAQQRSKSGSGGARDEIKWGELLVWFRQTQMRHERVRRAATAAAAVGTGGVGSHAPVGAAGDANGGGGGMSPAPTGSSRISSLSGVGGGNLARRRGTASTTASTVGPRGTPTPPAGTYSAFGLPANSSSTPTSAAAGIGRAISPSNASASRALQSGGAASRLSGGGGAGKR